MDCRRRGAAVGAVHVHVHGAGACMRRRMDTRMQHQIDLIMPVQGQATGEADDRVRELDNPLALIRIPVHLAF